MRILLLNQCFHPDVVSTAQHASDLAVALVEAGHEVTVVTSQRAYDSPSVRFPSREIWQGVRILRTPCFAFGKDARWRRALDSGSFLASCFCCVTFLPRFDVVIAMSSPPLGSVVGALLTTLKGGSMISWVMDLNPDEAVAAGWLRADSVSARFLERLLRYTFRHSNQIIVLDDFMKDRVRAKGAPLTKIAVIPPWSHDRCVRYDEDGRREFRRQFGLEGRFVVMYSGNHSPCHPLHTLLGAARRLASRLDITFCFVGGGSEFRRIRDVAAQEKLLNVACIPYQPLEKLAGSLSSADLHAVVMGDPFVGIVHPCKIYNILRLGIPLLYIGPPQSHVVQLLPQEALGRWAFLARHGDIDTVVSHILAAYREPGRVNPGQDVIARISHDRLVSHMVECVASASSSR